MAFEDLIPTSLTGWVSIITIAAFGVLAALNIFDRVKKKSRDEVDSIAGRVVQALKDEVEVLTRKLDEQGDRLTVMDHKILKLETENKTLRDVLSGQDKDSLEYRKYGLDAFHRIKQISNEFPVLQKDIKALYQSINKHLANVEEIEKDR